MGELVRREIKIKYKRSVLGILWSVLNPLLSMLILNYVFSNLFRFDIPNFLVYYLTGSLLFGFMHEATAGSLYSVFGNAGLIKKVYIPKYVFPAAKTISALVNFLFSLLALALVAALTGVVPSLALLAAPILFAMVFLFVLGLSFIFGAYAVFFRDLVHFHSIFLLIWMYITPIFYPEKILPPQFSWVLVFNPMYYYIRYFRKIVLEHSIPSLKLHFGCLLFAVASFAIGFFLFRRNQNRFILYF